MVMHPELGREELAMGAWVYVVNEIHLRIDAEAERGAAPWT